MIVLNGKLTEEERITLDGGYAFGKGFFETILVTDKPQFLQDHLDRLNNSLQVFGFPKEITKEEVEKAAKLLSCHNEALKVMVSETQTVCSKRNFAYKESQYEEGVSLARNIVTASSRDPLTKHKSLSYWRYLISLDNARENGYFDYYSINEKGHITETSTANIFIVKDGKLKTPAFTCGLLPGIIRQWVIEDFDVEEADITEEELLSCDGAFITNSLMGIMPVGDLDGIQLGRPDIIGTITQKYAERIEAGDGQD